MKPEKIVLILGLLLALVAAFTDVPYAVVALAVLGLLYGIIGVSGPEQTPLLLMALTLAVVSGTLSGIPEIGVYLTNILANTGSLLSAAAVAVIVKMLIARVAP